MSEKQREVISKFNKIYELASEIGALDICSRSLIAKRKWMENNLSKDGQNKNREVAGVIDKRL